MLDMPRTLGSRLAERIARAPLAITEAKPEDRDALGQFRYRVYVEQAGKNAEHADHENRTLLEPLDANSVNLIARDGEGGMVGAVRISRASDGWRLPEQCQQDPWPWVSPRQIACVGRLVVDRETAPIMATPALFAECYRWGLANAIRLCVVFCAPPLRSLFTGYGYQQFDEVHVDAFAGEQVPMLSCLRDRAHLVSVNSPFAHLVGRRRADPRDLSYMRSLKR